MVNESLALCEYADLIGSIIIVYSLICDRQPPRTFSLLLILLFTQPKRCLHSVVGKNNKLLVPLFYERLHGQLGWAAVVCD